MDTKCIIEKIEDRLLETEAIRTMKLVTGKEFFPSPVYYRNLETADEYAYIAGGIAWPSKIDKSEETKSGVAVIVAVDASGSDKPVFRALEEVTGKDISDLLQKCLVLREKYGFKKCPELFNSWWGDNETFESHVNDFNASFKGDGENWRGIYINPPPDLDSANAFESYAHRIRALSAKNVKTAAFWTL